MDTNIKEVSAGIDWLTVTSVTPENTRKMNDIRDRLLGQPELKASIPKKWGAMGYVGWNYGPMKLGVRNGQEAILILSGNICSNTVSWFEIDPNRVKRIDLQVTVGLKTRKPTYVAEMYKLLPNLPDFSRYAKMIKYISSFTGDTIYIGKRGRAHLLRIYDKSLDLGYRKTGYAWRYEMEYRHDAAIQVTRRLNETESRQKYILGQVTGELKKRSIASSFGAHSVIDAIEVSASISTAETKLDWLARCVSPVVVQLLNLGYEEEIISTLKLKHIVKWSKQNGLK